MQFVEKSGSAVEQNGREKIIGTGDVLRSCAPKVLRGQGLDVRQRAVMTAVLLHRAQNPLKTDGQPIKQARENRGVFTGVHNPARGPGIQGLIQRNALDHVRRLKLIESRSVQTVTALGQRSDPIALHCADTGRTYFAKRLPHAQASESRYDTTANANRDFGHEQDRRSSRRPLSGERIHANGICSHQDKHTKGSPPCSLNLKINFSSARKSSRKSRPWATKRIRIVSIRRPRPAKSWRATP